MNADFLRAVHDDGAGSGHDGGRLDHLRGRHCLDAMDSVMTPPASAAKPPTVRNLVIFCPMNFTVRSTRRVAARFAVSP